MQTINCLFSSKTWFKNRHFSDADGEKPDTRFLLLGNNGLLVNGKAAIQIQLPHAPLLRLITAVKNETSVKENVIGEEVHVRGCFCSACSDRPKDRLSFSLPFGLFS